MPSIAHGYAVTVGDTCSWCFTITMYAIVIKAYRYLRERGRVNFFFYSDFVLSPLSNEHLLIHIVYRKILFLLDQLEIDVPVFTKC